MNRIDKRFEDLKKQGRKGLVTFVMAGDPDQKTCADILKALPESGADLIEIGMPFTDPMADGPAIQRAALRSLAHGADMKMTLSLVQGFRKQNTETPVILMGYYNPIYAYGPERFAVDAAKAGVDGLIVVDLPPEEDSELDVPARKAGLHLIRLVTPVTREGRLGTILERASGFLYYVSITGVTGTAQASHEAVKQHCAAIRKRTDLPIAVGFGIRTPQDAAAFSSFADAVVVGSALVETIGAMEAGGKSLKDMERQVAALSVAIRD